jgi:EAL domain-containing protein (putative c-di-GMP-specific phosphodiesterase class I)/FixJ family two-component response regulator
VLDDEARIAGFVCQVLAVNGFAPLQFTSVLPCLARIKAAAPELLVLDLALGQSDAVEVIRQLEVIKFTGSVLLISGRDETTLNEIKQIGQRHGLAMLPVLRKPFRAADLKERVAALPESKPTPVEPSPRPKIAVDIDKALQENWLELWYQPKIDLKSLCVNGAEALLRGRHPEHGIVPPLDLLPAPGDPLHLPLSRFVIRRAMADWSLFREAGLPLKLAVNMPVSAIHAPEFILMVRDLLPRDPSFPGLIVEVTEDEVIRDSEWVREVATQLKLYNVWISLDDFGSAYSSLARLNDLPFVELKLDRSYVSNCAADKLKYGLCQTVVDLGHRFGASVCAEGVESAEELRALIGMGFDAAQGYLFAKPMPPEQCVKALSAAKPGRQRAASATAARSAARSTVQA